MMTLNRMRELLRTVYGKYCYRIERETGYIFAKDGQRGWRKIGNIGWPETENELEMAAGNKAFAPCGPLAGAR